MQTAEDILAVQTKYARELFKGNEAAVKKLFKQLAQQWHPDHNKSLKAPDVLRHLIELKTSALRQLGAKANLSAGLERAYLTSTGSKSVFKYLRSHKGDLGDILLSSSSLVYEIKADFRDVADKEETAVGALRYADAKMRDEIERYMPKLKRRLVLDDKDVLFFERPADTVLLVDLSAHFGGKIPAVHVAWIVSSLLNLACYLNWAGIVHSAISQDTVLVCPAKHSVMLVGGWGYSNAVGARPSVLPLRTASLVPRLAIKGEVVSPRVDIDLIKATAQEILGSAGGVGLKVSTDVPGPMIDWLLAPSSNNPVEEYQGWMETLRQAFGQRRFVDMKVVPADVYATPV